MYTRTLYRETAIEYVCQGFERYLRLNAEIQVASKNITQTLCEAPIRDKTASAYYPGITGGVLALFAYTLRMVSRMPCLGGGLGWDDAVLTVAMLEVIAMTVLVKVCESMSRYLNRIDC